MAEFNGENKVEGVFGGVNFGTEKTTEIFGKNQAYSIGNNDGTVFKKVEAKGLPIKPSIWSRVRSFLFQEIDLNAPIKVELTPYQQKVEDEINEFLHQEISFKGFFDIVFGKK